MAVNMAKVHLLTKSDNELNDSIDDIIVKMDVLKEKLLSVR